MSRPVCSTSSNEPAKKTKLLIMLKEVPHQLAYKILHKISCFALIRMRKTCSYINKTVEENKEAFSKRVDVGINLTLELEEKNNTLVIYSRSAPPYPISMLSQFQDNFSGVSIDKIHVTSRYMQEDRDGLFAQFLLRMNLRCVTISFYNSDPLNYLVQLSDLVESRTTDFGNAPRAQHGYEGQNTQHIETLMTGRRKSTFALHCQPNVILEQLELLTYFKKVRSFTMTTKQIHTLITKISNLTDLGCLEKISFTFKCGNPLLDGNFVFPEMELLWEMDGIKDHFEKYLRPDYIYKLVLTGNQCALMSLYTSRDFKRAEIQFVNNTSEEILKMLIEDLLIKDFTPSDKKEYLESSEDDQIQFIRQIYEKKCTVRRSGRQRAAR